MQTTKQNKTLKQTEELIYRKLWVSERNLERKRAGIETVVDTGESRKRTAPTDVMKPFIQICKCKYISGVCWVQDVGYLT